MDRFCDLSLSEFHNLRCQVFSCQCLFHSSEFSSRHFVLFFLSDSSNIPTAVNRGNICMIPWHNNQCNPGLHAAAVTILSCKQMTLFLEDTRWCLKLFLFVALKQIVEKQQDGFECKVAMLQVMQ